MRRKASWVRNLERGQTLTVHFGVDEPRDEVVRWLARGSAFGDHGVEIGCEVGSDARKALAIDSVLSAVHCRVRGLHDQVGPLGESDVVRRIDAKEDRDHGGRDRCHVFGDEITALTRDERVEQFVAQHSNEWLYPADAVLSDCRVDDPTDLAVSRFGDLADELLFRRHHYARGTEARLEHIDVLRGCKHIVMTSEEVRARRGPRHRTRAA
jgi:hypothetical protein